MVKGAASTKEKGRGEERIDADHKTHGTVNCFEFVCRRKCV